MGQFFIPALTGSFDERFVIPVPGVVFGTAVPWAAGAGSGRAQSCVLSSGEAPSCTNPTGIQTGTAPAGNPAASGIRAEIN